MSVDPDHARQPDAETPDGVPSDAKPDADSITEDLSLAAKVVALEDALAAAEQQADAAREAQLRAAAELENTRRRLERDAQKTAQFAAEGLLKALLAVADSVELGIKAARKPDAEVATLVEGMELTERQIATFLEKQGVHSIDPVGQPFNPDQHQAMSMIESADVAPNHVLAVMQKGYALHERLLRPAMVVVAKAPSAAAGETGTAADA